MFEAKSRYPCGFQAIFRVRPGANSKQLIKTTIQDIRGIRNGVMRRDFCCSRCAAPKVAWAGCPRTATTDVLIRRHDKGPYSPVLSPRITKKRGNVFLRSDFNELGGYRQISRALEKLLREGSPHQTRARDLRPSPAFAHRRQPTPVAGIRTLVVEALNRLGIETYPTRLEQDYAAGLTAQVPSGRRIAVVKRLRRKIGLNIPLSFERARPPTR